MLLQVGVGWWVGYMAVVWPLYNGAAPGWLVGYMAVIWPLYNGAAPGWLVGWWVGGLV